MIRAIKKLVRVYGLQRDADATKASFDEDIRYKLSNPRLLHMFGELEEGLYMAGAYQSIGRRYIKAKKPEEAMKALKESSRLYEIVTDKLGPDGGRRYDCFERKWYDKYEEYHIQENIERTQRAIRHLNRFMARKAA
ncbi:MAG: hypothetical protein Q7R96_02810 [Nanoarchaeota archaeon]|nr:hypothetical protein [Nanoarchaeota archaeon]